MNKDITDEIKNLAISGDANLVGIADLRLLKGIFTYPSDFLKKYRYGISIAVSLDQFGRYDNETENRAFSLLDKIALLLKSNIEGRGYRANIIPPDERVKEEGPLYWRGAISHKAVAKTAGLGWIGKSMLLVTPKFGPRVCLVTVLTDMALTPNKPSKNMCSDCKECVKACPVNALIETKFDDHPKKLGEAFDVAKCGPWIDKTWDDGKICYACMLACPWGKHKGGN